MSIQGITEILRGRPSCQEVELKPVGEAIRAPAFLYADASRELTFRHFDPQQRITICPQPFYSATMALKKVVQERSTPRLFRPKNLKMPTRVLPGEVLAPIDENHTLKDIDISKWPLAVEMIEEAENVHAKVREELRLFKKHQKSPFDGDANVMSSACYFSTDFPSMASNIEGIFRVYEGTSPDPGITEGLKCTGSFGILTGALALFGAHKALKTAKKTHDVAGRVLSEMRLVRGCAESINGMMVIPVQLARSSVIQGAAKVSLLNITAKIGCVTTPIIYAFLAGPFVYSIGKAAMELHRLSKCADDSERLAYLEEQIRLSSEDHRAIFADIPQLREKEYASLLKEEVTVSEKDFARLTEGDLMAIQLEVRALMDDFKLQDKRGFDFDYQNVADHLYAKLVKEFAQGKVGKELAFARLFGSQALEELKSHISQPIKPASEVVGSIKKHLNGQLTYNLFLVGACLLAIAGFLATNIISGGMPLVAFLIVSIVVNAIMLYLDGYALNEALKTMRPGKWNLVFVAIASLLAIASSAAGAYFAATIVTRVMCIVVGALMVTTNGVVYAHNFIQPKYTEEQLEVKRRIFRNAGTSFALM